MALAEYGKGDAGKIPRSARDVDDRGAGLNVFAGKWPDAVDVLNRRIEHLNPDAADIAKA